MLFGMRRWWSLGIVVEELSVAAYALATASSRQFKPLQHSSRRVDPLKLERSLGFPTIIGSDESGTGCIAGPIFTVSCHVKESSVGDNLVAIQDCKRLTLDECREIYEHVQAHPDVYVWESATRSNQEIDESTVQLCVQEAFYESIEDLVGRLDEDRSEIYSIVDGHRSPGKLSVKSRPWKKADALIYSVALASCLARHFHNEWIIQNAQGPFPLYEFERHGGYPSALHIEKLHKYGPTTIHRKSCKPVQDRLAVGATTSDSQSPSGGNSDGMDRRSALSLCGPLVTAFAAAQPAYATYFDKTTGTLLPEVGEIAAAVPTGKHGLRHRQRYQRF